MCSIFLHWSKRFLTQSRAFLDRFVGVFFLILQCIHVNIYIYCDLQLWYKNFEIDLINFDIKSTFNTTFTYFVIFIWVIFHFYQSYLFIYLLVNGAGRDTANQLSYLPVAGRWRQRPQAATALVFLRKKWEKLYHTTHNHTISLILAFYIYFRFCFVVEVLLCYHVVQEVQGHI